VPAEGIELRPVIENTEVAASEHFILFGSFLGSLRSCFKTQSTRYNFGTSGEREIERRPGGRRGRSGDGDVSGYGRGLSGPTATASTEGSQATN
jgi:hypothetical protein